MTQETINEIERIRGTYTAENARYLNHARKSVDGKFLTNCFCKSSIVKSFMDSFYAWYDNEYISNNTINE